MKISGKAKTLTGIAVFGLVLLFGLPVVLNTLRQADLVEANWTQAEFREQFEQSNIVSGTIVYNARTPFMQDVHGKYAVIEDGVRVELPFSLKVRLTEPLERQLLASGLFSAAEPGRSLASYFYYIVPILAGAIFLLVGFLLIRLLINLVKWTGQKAAASK